MRAEERKGNVEVYQMKLNWRNDHSSYRRFRRGNRMSNASKLKLHEKWVERGAVPKKADKK